MPRRYVMAISCICHYRPAHKLVTAHLECRALLRVFVVSSFSFYSPPLSSSPPPSPSSFSSLSLFFLLRLTISLVYFCLTSFRLPFIWTSLLFFFLPSFFVCAKCLPPSRLHSGGEASIVIVPHQRRSAINLSPRRAESERRSSRADHTRNTGRAINLCPPEQSFNGLLIS